MKPGQTETVADRLRAGEQLSALAQLRREVGVNATDLAAAMGRRPSTVRRREYELTPFRGELAGYRNALRAVLVKRDDPLGRLATIALREAPSDPRAWLQRLAESLEGQR